MPSSEARSMTIIKTTIAIGLLLTISQTEAAKCCIGMFASRTMPSTTTCPQQPQFTIQNMQYANTNMDCASPMVCGTAQCTYNSSTLFMGMCGAQPNWDTTIATLNTAYQTANMNLTCNPVYNAFINPNGTGLDITSSSSLHHTSTVVLLSLAILATMNSLFNAI